MRWTPTKLSIVRPALLSAAAMLSAVIWTPGANAAILSDATCASPSDYALQPALPAIPLNAQIAKSSAILGGQPSALELIRLAQEQSEASPATTQEALATAEDSAAQLALSPAAGGMRLEPAACLSEALVPHTPALGSEDFLASRRVEIGRTNYDAEWLRVSGEATSENRYRRILGTVADDRMSTLASVNRWVNHSIAFVADRDLFAQTDFWAGANETLRLRAGDCEDIALTKMQLLADAGVPREDMILTIARDLVRNADHAVLIVHYEGRYYMLDNSSDQLFDAALAHDYRPILSFGSNHTWLHGY